MADIAMIMAGIECQSGVRYLRLIPSMQGFQAALSRRPDEAVVFGSVGEGFSQKNTICFIAQSIERSAPVVQAGLDAEISVCGVMSFNVGSLYEGDNSHERTPHIDLNSSTVICAAEKQAKFARINLSNRLVDTTPLPGS